MAYQFHLTDPDTETCSDALAPQAQGWVTCDGVAVAGGALWWNGPGADKLRLGCLGHLQATTPAAAVIFLQRACAVLGQRGCTLALGPMDGSSWQSYRCALTWDNGPPFWGEPQTDPRWVDWFTQAGFTPVGHYASRWCPDLTQTYPPRRRRHSPVPVQIHSAQGLAVEALLPQLYPLVIASFRRQPFFQPLPEDRFIQHLRPLLTQIDPALVQLAWDGDRLVGVALAHADSLAPAAERRLIIKTLAILPGRSYAGLGTTLLEAAHRAGVDQGYQQAIHALMHRHNPSLTLSRRYSQPFRNYVLMGKPLASADRA